MKNKMKSFASQNERASGASLHFFFPFLFTMRTRVSPYAARSCCGSLNSLFFCYLFTGTTIKQQKNDILVAVALSSALYKVSGVCVGADTAAAAAKFESRKD